MLLIDGSDLSRIIYHALSDEFKVEMVVREAKAPLFAFLARRLKKLGWWTLFGQVIFVGCVVPLLSREASRRRSDILREYELNDSPIPAGSVIDVSSINDVRTADLLLSLSTGVTVVNGTRILKEQLLDTIGGVFLNTHVGITPLYRGVHGGYWALASGDAEHFGTTIHKIDKGIDTGEIVAQATIRPSEEDNFSTYPLLQIAIAIPLLKQAIRDALKGNLETAPTLARKSKLWSHPTVFQYLKSRFVLGIR